MVEEGAVRRRLPVLVGLVIFAVGAARAQTAPDQTEPMRILLERVQQLEKRVAELETKTVAAAVPTAEAPANAPAPAKPELAEAAPAPSPVHQHETTESQATTRQLEARYPSLQVRGFDTMTFSNYPLGGTIRPSAIGTPRSIMALGCRPRSAGLR